MKTRQHNCECVPAVNGTDDREARSKFWIAAYTKSRSEKKAAAELAKILGIETYAPTQVIVKQWSDRRKKIEVVVIPMVIFAESPSEKEMLEIKKHPLILKVLTIPGQNTPTKIPAKQIERLKFMLGQSDEPVEFVKADFKLADKVRVVRGYFSGFEGSVQKTSDGKSYIVITLDMLGGARVSINPSDLELIQSK